MDIRGRRTSRLEKKRAKLNVITNVSSWYRPLGLYSGRIATSDIYSQIIQIKEIHLSQTTWKWAKHKVFRNIGFSDKSKFDVFVCRQLGERVQEDWIHEGGNTLVWGSFGGGQVGNLDENMTKEVYLNIFMFIGDGDPKHILKIVKELLRIKFEEGMILLFT